MTIDRRANCRDSLHKLMESGTDFVENLAALMTPDCEFTIAQPIGKLTGPVEIARQFYAPLRAAFSHCQRRDIIFLGSETFEPGQEGYWVASVTSYIGNFKAALWGVKPSGSVAQLHAGEFYKINDDGRITEARIIFDLPRLMFESGQAPFPVTLGNSSLFSAPATLDGVLPSHGNGEASVGVMNLMLDRLIDFDPETKMSKGMIGKDGVWHDDMMWYGPHPIGTTYRWTGFVKDHREPFLDAFPTRLGGGTVTQVGDGNFAALCGEGMPMRHDGNYLGLPATGRDVVLPVMDFYRIEDNQLIENWVFLDMIALFEQMGVNIITGEGWPQ